MTTRPAWKWYYDKTPGGKRLPAPCTPEKVWAGTTHLLWDSSYFADEGITKPYCLSTDACCGFLM